MNSDLEAVIVSVFEDVYRMHVKKEPPKLTRGAILLETGLDSLGFAILVTRLDEELGFDPFTLDEEAFYPQTFGDFVDFYWKHSAA